MPTKSRHQAPALLGASMSPGPGAQSRYRYSSPRHDVSSLGEPLSPTRAPTGLRAGVAQQSVRP